MTDIGHRLRCGMGIDMFCGILPNREAGCCDRMRSLICQDSGIMICGSVPFAIRHGEHDIGKGGKIGIIPKETTAKTEESGCVLFS